MKKWQFAIGIMAGLCIGALVALAIGNTLTAVLSGVLSAVATTWITSLNWAGFKAWVCENVEVWKFLCKCKEQCYAGIAWLRQPNWATLARWIKDCLQGPWRALRLTAKRCWQVTRKALFILFGLQLLKNIFSYGEVRFCVYLCLLTGISLYGLLYLNGIQAEPVLIIVLLLLAIGIAPSAGVAACIIAFCFFFDVINDPLRRPNPSDIEKERKNDPILYFALFLVLICDDSTRSPLRILAYSLLLSLRNALMLILFGLRMVIWVPAKLFTYKTGAAIITALVLSLIHLSTSYAFGWIEPGSVNFSLLLAICLFVGGLAGRYIHDMRPFTARFPQYAYKPYEPLTA